MKELEESTADLSIEVEDYEWIGIVHEGDVKANVALITPLAFYDPDRGWQPITDNERSQLFPNNGKVARFTKDFPKDKVHQLYYLQPKQNQRPPASENLSIADSRYSRYLIFKDPETSVSSLAQVLNWSSRASHVYAIPNLLDQGILTRDCLTRTIYIRYQNQFYGPLHLEPDVHAPQAGVLKPREYNQGSRSGGQPLLLPGYAFVRDDILLLENQVFVDLEALGSPVSQIDWSLPQTVVKRLLKASNGVLPELQKKERLIEKEINELAALNSIDGSEALRIEACTIQRAQHIIHHHIEHLSGLQTLIEELPEEHPFLIKARQLEVQRRKEQIELECQPKYSQMKALQAQIQSRQQTLTRLNKDIEEAQQKLNRVDADLTALDASVQKRLTELRQELVNLLTDLQLTSPLPLDSLPTHRNTMLSESSRPIRQHSYFVEERVTTLTPPSDLHWEEIAIQNKLDKRLIKTCTAALLAGLIPATSSLVATILFPALAQTFIGGRVWYVPISLTAISPLDLLGSITAPQQVFIPAAGSLADILIEAHAHPGLLGLIVLEGVDRVPFLPAIEPLLRQYRTVHRQCQQAEKSPASQEMLQLFHARALSPNDPYRELSDLVWPPNLLLGVTFDQDVGSFPLPEAYSPWFAHIERLNMKIDTATQSEESVTQKNYQVTPTGWHTWEEEVVKQKNNQNMGYSEGVELWQLVFSSALHLFGEEDPHAVIKQLWP